MVLPLLVGGVCLFAGSASAQVSCHSDVSYKVTRGEEDQEVLWRREMGHGQDEASIRSELSNKLVLSLREALLLCREQHENVSGCVASKHSSMGSLMQQMHFSARAKLQDAIEKDCLAQQGVCHPAKSSEIVCVVPTVAEPAAVEAAAPEKEAAKKPSRR